MMYLQITYIILIHISSHKILLYILQYIISIYIYKSFYMIKIIDLWWFSSYIQVTHAHNTSGKIYIFILPVLVQVGSGLTQKRERNTN